MFERTGREPTQGEVGAIVGVKPNAASAWESDVSTPPIEAVPAIAAYLGVTPGWLAFGQEPRYAEVIATAQGIYEKFRNEDATTKRREDKVARDREQPRDTGTPKKKRRGA